MVNKELYAQKYLSAFDGDIQAAIENLQKFGKPTVRKNIITNNNPVIVELSEVSKKYKLGRQHVDALKNVSLTIREGEFVALTGSSGSGKSTLLQLIGALDKPSQGRVLVNGQDISRLSDKKLSVFRNKTIGFVFQFFYLQPFLTLQSNLEVPAMFARTKPVLRSKKAKELSEKVGLSERLKHLPKELSGGQMQRAAIARSLLNGPKIILADEPTGNLDSKNGEAIIDLFDEIRKTYGTTVVVVTHDAKIAARADREIVLSDGEVKL